MARVHTATCIAATWLLLAAVASAANFSNIGPSSLFIGNGTFPGSSNGAGRDALLNTPEGCRLDNSSNFYIADTVNHVIKRVNASSATSTTWLGLIGDAGLVVGNQAATRLQSPTDIVFNSAGDTAYVVDMARNAIISSTVSATPTTTHYIGETLGLPGSADGSGNAASLNLPYGIAIRFTNDANVELYVTEQHRVRKIYNRATSVLAGAFNASGFADGNSTTARFNNSRGIVVQNSGRVFVSDTNNRRIREIDQSGNTLTFSGTGAEGHDDGIASATWGLPWGLAMDSSAANLYVSDKGNNIVRRITIDTKLVTTVFGNLEVGWTASASSVSSRLSGPTGVCLHTSGLTRLYVTGSHSVSFVEIGGVATTTTTIAASTTTAAATTIGATTTVGGNVSVTTTPPPTPTGNGSTPMTTTPGSTPSISAAPSMSSILVALATIAALLVA